MWPFTRRRKPAPAVAVPAAPAPAAAAVAGQEVVINPTMAQRRDRAVLRTARLRQAIADWERRPESEARTRKIAGLRRELAHRENARAR
ncbi:MAG: hypothetical protein A3E78_12120 [Alphaproteobacteria bacterium RIFCSPHIGHO2_12_FULL_63_12]|nr:MAG: hypothetical protein A3E78_12120 [Alphaproteobacteria bacterium RIFCSPHIGHO2_12_FULL_63_12]